MQMLRLPSDDQNGEAKIDEDGRELVTPPTINHDLNSEHNNINRNVTPNFPSSLPSEENTYNNNNNNNNNTVQDNNNDDFSMMMKPKSNNDDQIVENDDGDDDDDTLFSSSPPPSLFSPLSYETFRETTLTMLPHFAGSVTNQFGAFVGQSILMMAVGRHLSVADIASVGVGLSTSNLFGISIAVGASSGCETLISQAFGRKDYVAVAKWTQLGVLACLGLCVPISIFFMFSAPVVKFLFGSQYVEGATTFLRWSIPFLYLQSGASCIIKSFQASHAAKIPASSRLFSAAAMIFCAFVFVPILGIRGAALSMGLGSLTQIVAMFMIAKREIENHETKNNNEVVVVGNNNNDDDENDNNLASSSTSSEPVFVVPPVLKLKWNLHTILLRSFGFIDDDRMMTPPVQNVVSSTNNNSCTDDTTTTTTSTTASQETDDTNSPPTNIENNIQNSSYEFTFTKSDLWEFTRVAAPGAISTILEWSCFEAMTLICSHIGRLELAAFQLYLAMSLLFVSCAFALTITTSSFVGKALGENKPKSAVVFAQVCVIHSFLLGIATSLFLILLDEHFFSLYTTNDSLLKMLSSVVFIYALLRTTDNVQIVLQGVARGAGQQKIVPFLVGFSLSVIGVPTAAFFGLGLKLGLAGVLLGFSFGMLTLAPLLAWRIERDFDWCELAQEASSTKKVKK